MSLPALQSDSVAGTALWLNHVFVHVGGPTDGSSGIGTWSYDTSAQNTISYRASDQHWLDGSAGTGADAPSAITSSSTHSSTTHLANPEYVFLWYNSGDFLGKFANPFYVAPTGGGGDTGTEGVPTVEWSAFFSKDPGSNYWRWTVTGLNTDSSDYIYLYDYMPTLTGTGEGPPIGQRSFAASSSSSTQYGLFVPDESKTYYVINYLAGSSSTNLNAVVLASKNFSSKKVFSNFW